MDEEFVQFESREHTKVRVELAEARNELAALRGAARCHLNQWPMQPDEVAAWNRALNPC